nr:hypothetical protein 2 [Mute swan feces associated tombus-like virus 5]
MRGTLLKPMRPGAFMRIPSEPEHRQRTYCIYYQPMFDCVRKVYVHNNCRCNEIIALRNRVLFDCPVADPRTINRCKFLARMIADWLPRETIMDGEWTEQYTGRKRRKYQQAALDLAITPIRKSDAYISAFIKAEKIFQLKDPRLIQARSARYNYMLGNYLKPIEHHLYNIKGTGRLSKFLPPGRLIAKGCNMERRARLIQSKMDRFSNPLVISLDASRFDAHVTAMLEVEHLIYNRYWRCPILQRLLRWQVNNRGRTSTGVRYGLRGSRMSGDMNTALGNCIISIIMLANVMRELRMKPNSWDMLCDGDDVLVFIDKSQSSIIEHLPSLYLAHGFVIKVENITTDYSKVLFCQSSPIETLHGPKMVALPHRVLSRSLVGVKHWNEPKFIPKYLALIGYCELALNIGVPVMQEFALTVLSWGSTLPRKVHISGRVVKALREERQHTIAPCEITPEARVSFEEATGIPPEEQRAYEAALRALNRHGAEEETSTDTPPTRWAPRWITREGKGAIPSTSHPTPLRASIAH